MNEPGDSERPTELEQEALYKVRQLVSGTATVDDVDDVRRWRQLSPAHAEAFAFATRVWDRLGPAGRNVLARHGEDALSGLRPVARRAISRRAVVAGALAASAGFFVVRPPFELWPSYSEFAADYRTATGEQRRITLANGASVELNTRTSVALRRAAGESDRLELISGEAAITTGRQLTRPLAVIAGDGETSSQNASFIVRHDGTASCVTCLEGAVRVRRDDSELMLSARHQVSYAARGLNTPIAIDPAVVTAWQDGLLVFHQAPLSEVVAEINRYRPGKIVLLNAELGRRAVNARFHVDNVDEIMSLAQRVFGAKITSLPGDVVLLS